MMQTVTIGRSLKLLVVYFVGHVFGYALLLYSNIALSVDEFGIFYASWALITVATAPATAILIEYGHTLAKAIHTVDTPHVFALIAKTLRRIFIRLGPVIALCTAGLFLSMAYRETVEISYL